MRYPAAKFLGCAPENYSRAPIRPLFIVVHVTQGDNQGGVDSWFHNPSAQVSAHFSIAKDGTVHQYVDTLQTAYHCAGWNDVSIGIEHLGLTGQHLTLRQQLASRKLMKWLHATHRCSLEYVVNPYNPKGGVIGHGKIPEGALSHPSCPGQPILDDVKRFLRPTPVQRLATRLKLGYQRP